MSAAAGLGTLGIRDVCTAARSRACWSGAGGGTMLSASSICPSPWGPPAWRQGKASGPHVHWSGRVT